MAVFEDNIVLFCNQLENHRKQTNASAFRSTAKPFNNS